MTAKTQKSGSVSIAFVEEAMQIEGIEQAKIDAVLLYLTMMHKTAEQPDDFTSACCEGERCSMCGEPAARKVGEEIFSDDPNPHRHNLTAYVCKEHFDQIVGRGGYRKSEADLDWQALSEKWSNEFLNSIQIPAGADKDKNIRPSLHAFILANKLFEKFLKLGIGIGEGATKQESVSLEKCAIATSQWFRGEDYGQPQWHRLNDASKEQHRKQAKAVLDAAGVKYVD